MADKIGTDITKYVSSDIDTSKIESRVGFGARTTIVVRCGMCRLCHINLYWGCVQPFLIDTNCSLIIQYNYVGSI